MNHMKKIISLLLIFTVAFTLCSCETKKKEEPTPIEPQGDIVEPTEVKLPDEATTKAGIKEILEIEYDDLYYDGRGLIDSTLVDQMDVPEDQEQYLSKVRELILKRLDSATFATNVDAEHLSLDIFLREKVRTDGKNIYVLIKALFEENQIGIKWSSSDYDSSGYDGSGWLLFEDPELYSLIKNRKINEHEITPNEQAALDVIGSYLEEQARKHIDWLEEKKFGTVIDHKLISFALNGTYDNVDGFDKVELYDYYYGYLTDDPDETFRNWGGGTTHTNDWYFMNTTSIESTCAIVGYKDGKIAALAFDGQDAHTSTVDGYRKTAISRLTGPYHIDVKCVEVYKFISDFKSGTVSYGDFNVDIGSLSQKDLSLNLFAFEEVEYSDKFEIPEMVNILPYESGARGEDEYLVPREEAKAHNIVFTNGDTNDTLTFVWDSDAAILETAEATHYIIAKYLSEYSTQQLYQCAANYITQYDGLDALYEKGSEILIADVGQSIEEVAQEFTEQYYALFEELLPIDRMYKSNIVITTSIVDKDKNPQLYAYPEYKGKILFSSGITFTPGIYSIMAGNTGHYDGDPEMLWREMRVCYLEKTADGYRGKIMGTGW